VGEVHQDDGTLAVEGFRRQGRCGVGGRCSVGWGTQSRCPEVVVDPGSLVQSGIFSVATEKPTRL
jgi:hypothetical protein